MKKIMFNDRYGLTQAVLERKKTMTRRIVIYPKKFKGVEDTMLEFNRRIGADIYYDCVVCDMDGHELGQLPLPYEVGDVVAIAQSYESLVDKLYHGQEENFANRVLQAHGKKKIGQVAGWRNKMYVRADLMPHHIRITDLWSERLQDISDEDCLKEGVKKWIGCHIVTGIMEHHGQNNVCFDTPQYAFRTLINRISGPRTWDDNPWVIAYTFELVD